VTVNYDYDRTVRLGMPEAVYCEGKSASSLNTIIGELADRSAQPVLFTRLTTAQVATLDPAFATLLDHDPASATATLHGHLPKRSGSVAIVAAGTSDLRVAREAQQTLEFSGFSACLIVDVGVAGLHRLLDRIDEIRAHDVVIIVAGMDAALASVMGGLVGAPLIGVPTSVGYGVATGGTTALHAMLASCGQGVLVTNIDNGFGGACGAIRILNMLHKD
jgi:pyridinium-3,5-biscarboxylic acid mononucleotide synthase